jgi:hypothetical protein
MVSAVLFRSQSQKGTKIPNERAADWRYRYGLSFDDRIRAPAALTGHA